jgi:Tol biopolymer transport system component
VTTAADKYGPVWSGANRLLYFSKQASRVELWSVPVEGSRATGSPVLESHDIGVRAAALGAASGTYYYVKVDAGIDLTFVTSINGGRASMGTISTHFAGYQPIWSPDGGSIAFYRNRSAGKEVELIVRSGETGQERVVHASTSTLPLFWFSDGRSLLEQIGGDRKNRPRLSRVDLATGASATLGGDLPPGLTRASAAALSHDERTLYSVARDATRRSGGWDRVIAIDVATGAVRLVCALAGPPETLPGVGGVALALSPDPTSSTLAIAAEGSQRYRTRLIRVETDGSGYRELYGPYPSDSPYQKLAWSKDGHSIFFSMTTSGVFAGTSWQVMEINANGGNPWPVTDAIAGSDNGATFDLTRDNSRIAINPNPASSQRFDPAAGLHVELRRILLSSGK